MIKMQDVFPIDDHYNPSHYMMVLDLNISKDDKNARCASLY